MNKRDAGLEKLLEASARGNREAFARLYDLTSARLFGIIRRILPNAEQAEDALQEAYVKIWQRAELFRPELGSGIGWMMTIARNQAIDLRRRSAERMSALSEEVDEATPSDDADPEALAVHSDSMTRLHSCLQELPTDRQQMIVLAYHQGWSREELSQRFQRPVTTIKTILRRSLMALKECLDAA